VNTFSADGSRFVASCLKGEQPCFYDTASGKAVSVPGVHEGWMTVGSDSRGWLYFHDERKGAAPRKLFRLDPATGITSPIAELAPRNRANVLSILHVHVAASGEA
jgi:hypothetical protein